MKDDLYIKVDSVWCSTTMDQIQTVYEKKKEMLKKKFGRKWDNECCVVYAKEVEGGHLLECHWGSCHDDVVGACTSCTQGFSRCVVCGAIDYEQTWAEGSVCSGRDDIILLHEDPEMACCYCGTLAQESLHKVNLFEIGSTTVELIPCSFCVKCNEILAESKDHYFKDGKIHARELPY